MATQVVDGGAIAYLAQLIASDDAKLKRQVFSAFAQIAKHSVDLAELVVEAEIFPGVYPSLKGRHDQHSMTFRAYFLSDPDEYVQKNVATLIREVAKHSPELAQLVVNSGGGQQWQDELNSTY